MPVLEVEVVGPIREVERVELAQHLADAAGAALASRPQGTWVRLRELDPRDYAENGGAPAGPPPVFCRVLLGDPLDGDARAEQAAALARAVAGATGRPVVVS